MRQDRTGLVKDTCIKGESIGMALELITSLSTLTALLSSLLFDFRTVGNT